MSIGFGQIIIIILVIILIFGASRLPKIAEDLAKGMKAFKRGLADETDDPKESIAPTPQPSEKKALPKKAFSSSKKKPTQTTKVIKKAAAKKTSGTKKQSKAVKNA